MGFMNNWYDLWPANIYQVVVALDVLEVVLLTILIGVVLTIGREDD